MLGHEKGPLVPSIKLRNQLNKSFQRNKMKFIAVIATLIAATQAQNMGQCKVVSSTELESVENIFQTFLSSILGLYGRLEQVQGYLWPKR